MTQETPELLPCPFCRGDGFVEAPALGCDWHVYCDDCGASGADCQSAIEAVDAWNTRTSASPPEGREDALYVSLGERIASVQEFLGYGFWRECTGCYETEDGYPVGSYPRSEILGCSLGGGCSECGGIGAVFDSTDYEAMAELMAREDASLSTTPPKATDKDVER